MKTKRFGVSYPSLGRARQTALAGFLIAMVSQIGHAASRSGGPTDDSICDVGSMEARSLKLAPHDFVMQSCRNGHLLIGTSVVPVGGFPPRIEVLAGEFCQRADIDVRYSTRPMAGIEFEYASVRCKITKHTR